jgi:hypothetical protein
MRCRLCVAAERLVMHVTKFECDGGAVFVKLLCVINTIWWIASHEQMRRQATKELANDTNFDFMASVLLDRQIDETQP